MNQLCEESEAEIRDSPRPELETPALRKIGTIEQHVKAILKRRMPLIIRFWLPQKMSERRAEAVANEFESLQSHGKEGLIALGKLMFKCGAEMRERIAPILIKSDEPQVLESLHQFMMIEFKRMQNRKIRASLFVVVYFSALIPNFFIFQIRTIILNLLYSS